MRSSSYAAFCCTSCLPASSRSATSDCSPTATAVRRSPCAGTTSMLILPRPPPFLLICSNRLFVAAAPVVNAEPCALSPASQPMPWPPMQPESLSSRSTLPEPTYAHLPSNSQSLTNEPDPGRRTPVPSSACQQPKLSLPAPSSIPVSRCG